MQKRKKQPRKYFNPNGLALMEAINTFSKTISVCQWSLLYWRTLDNLVMISELFQVTSPLAEKAEYNYTTLEVD